MSEIWIEKYFSLSTHLLKEAVHQKLTLEEFILLIYFEDTIDKTLNVEMIKNATSLSETTILTAFNSLMSKHFIDMQTNKDIDGRRKEEISLNPFYQKIAEKKQVEEKQLEKIDIFECFEKEFGRPISSMEYEIIGAWIEKGFQEEMILEALKEAVYNGVTSLRYIDKILYEWQKKGYRSLKDAKQGFLKKEEIKTPSLFDYNWLEDSDE